MASQNKNLAESLKVLNKLQRNKGNVLKSDEIPRAHRERLLKSDFIREVIKGWYIITNPSEKKGESTLWYSTFWDFCSRYLNDRYKKSWCISPEQSLIIQSGSLAVPKQLLIRAPKANNHIIKLPYDTSILNIKSTLPGNGGVIAKEGIRMLSVPTALISCNSNFFKTNSMEARIALSMISDASEILPLLLEEGRHIIAGRLAGAFDNIGNKKIANDIIKTMKIAGYRIIEVDPFTERPDYQFRVREISPYVNRIKMMWSEMRELVLRLFPKGPGIKVNSKKYLKGVQEIYLTDAYHSLSIEGYKVTPELIERIEKGIWNPETNEEDREQKDAMAAKGYWQAFNKVKISIENVLKGMNPGLEAEKYHGDWYREMFSPAVAVGILKPADLAGYRNAPVFIRNSSHVPMKPEAVRDVMPVFFELLKNEDEPAVRVVLGHFFFIYIHPYMDGNGRMARFLMNVMLASGGYPWTVIPVEERNNYMQALEKASTEGDIQPFTKFLSRLVKAGISGKPIAKRI